FFRDDARPARHVRNQADGRGAMGDGGARLGRGFDAADLDEGRSSQDRSRVPAGGGFQRRISGAPGLVAESFTFTFCPRCDPAISHAPAAWVAWMLPWDSP